MKNWILIIVMMFIFQLASYAHEDTPIKLCKDGKLIGLPEKYSNAKFDSVTFTLTINDKQIIVPECIKDFFINFKNYDITFSASWYHNSEFLPHYIHMDIITAENPYGYQVFFNLETLEIFQIFKPEMILNKDKPNRFLFNEQVISEECRKSILNSIKTLPNNAL